jgi:hypothetical protein
LRKRAAIESLALELIVQPAVLSLSKDCFSLLAKIAKTVLRQALDGGVREPISPDTIMIRHPVEREAEDEAA